MASAQATGFGAAVAVIRCSALAFLESLSWPLAAAAALVAGGAALASIGR